jgi:hypothetical protein
MNPMQRATVLLVQFQALQAILRRENGCEWLGLITEIVVALQPPFTDENQCSETVKEAKRRFYELLSEKGGLSEFYIPRDALEDRVAANKELDRVKEAILAA